MDVQIYERNPLIVEAVQVTEDNIYEVAKWCGGDVQTIKGYEPGIAPKKVIELDTLRPLYKKHTQALAGDWILKSENGFKIYADIAFQKGFKLVKEPMALKDAMKDLAINIHKN
jgi:hypothetical protein